MSATVPPYSEPPAITPAATASVRSKIVLIGSLYLAQGLPFGFFTLALPVLLRDAGYSNTAIGALSLLNAPWALKFLWAAFLDQCGSTKAWLLGLQIASVIGALLLTRLEPDSGFLPLLIAAIVFNLIAASQDVVTDGLAVRTLDIRERGLANGLQVGAYRIGMILGGGVLLFVFARTNWATMFACMALMLAVTVLPVLRLRAPPRDPGYAAPNAGELLIHWVRRFFTPGMPVFVGLIFCYRFGDQVLTAMLGPFLRDSGLTLEAIALMKGTVGSATSLVGAAIGGWFVFNTSRRTAVLASGLAQAAAFCLYIVAAFKIGGTPLLWTATIAEGVLGTMATVALFTLMMDASEMRHAGTDYTLFASVVVAVTSLGALAGGAIADAFGYAATFIVGTVLAVLGCLAVVRVLDRKPVLPNVAEAWARGTSKN